jgi:hypothetical protein
VGVWGCGGVGLGLVGVWGWVWVWGGGEGSGGGIGHIQDVKAVAGSLPEYIYIHTSIFSRPTMSRSSLNMLWHIVFANNSTTLTNNSRVSFVRHGVVVVVVIYNIYIIYISDKSLNRFRSDTIL